MLSVYDIAFERYYTDILTYVHTYICTDMLRNTVLILLMENIKYVFKGKV